MNDNHVVIILCLCLWIMQSCETGLTDCWIQITKNKKTDQKSTNWILNCYKHVWCFFFNKEGTWIRQYSQKVIINLWSFSLYIIYCMLGINVAYYCSSSTVLMSVRCISGSSLYLEFLDTSKSEVSCLLCNIFNEKVS